MWSEKSIKMNPTNSRWTRGSGKTHKWKILKTPLPLIWYIAKLLSKSLNYSFFQVKFLSNTPGPQESNCELQNKTIKNVMSFNYVWLDPLGYYIPFRYVGNLGIFPKYSRKKKGGE